MTSEFEAGTLAGKTIVITGSAQGIGRAVSVAAARSGMRVIGLDVQSEAGESTAQLVREIGAEAWFYPCDVSDTVRLEQIFDSMEIEVGPIDVLVNNAARVTHTAPEDLSAAEWAQIVGVNLTGMIFSAQYAGRSMIRAGKGGSIINLSSIGGIAALGRGNFAYSVTKAGIIGMTHELAAEWAGFHIRVNAVAPSQVHTEGFQLLMDDADIVGGDIASAAVAGIPLGRLAEAEDIASAVLFLAGPGASFITGVTLPVDGGSLALHAGGSLRPAVETTSSGSSK